jgi:microcystin-dependent protein
MEKLYINDFESGNGSFKNMKSDTGTFEQLTAKVLKLEETVEMLRGELKIVDQLKKELIRISSERTVVKNKLYANEELVSVPVGTIVAFAGREIPEGWKVCDGNSSPNLDDKVIFGTTNKNRNWEVETGRKSVVLNEPNIPSHAHEYERVKYTFNTRQAVVNSTLFSSGDKADFYNGSSENTSRLFTTRTGEGHAFDITPPNVKMLYIIKMV